MYKETIKTFIYISEQSMWKKSHKGKSELNPYKLLNEQRHTNPPPKAVDF